MDPRVISDALLDIISGPFDALLVNPQMRERARVELAKKAVAEGYAGDQKKELTGVSQPRGPIGSLFEKTGILRPLPPTAPDAEALAAFRTGRVKRREEERQEETFGIDKKAARRGEMDQEARLARRYGITGELLEGESPEIQTQYHAAARQGEADRAFKLRGRELAESNARRAEERFSAQERRSAAQEDRARDVDRKNMIAFKRQQVASGFFPREFEEGESPEFIRELEQVAGQALEKEAWAQARGETALKTAEDAEKHRITAENAQIRAQALREADYNTDRFDTQFEGRKKALISTYKQMSDDISERRDRYDNPTGPTDGERIVLQKIQTELTGMFSERERFREGARRRAFESYGLDPNSLTAPTQQEIDAERANFDPEYGISPEPPRAQGTAEQTSLLNPFGMAMNDFTRLNSPLAGAIKQRVAQLFIDDEAKANQEALTTENVYDSVVPSKGRPENIMRRAAMRYR